MTTIVECINERENMSQIKKGEMYKFSHDSLYGDSDGEWYADIFTLDDKRIGQLKLSHFKGIRKIK